MTTFHLGAIRWHRPLLWLATAMGLLALVCVGAMLFDSRQLLGVSVWEKPLKFAISTAIYAVTWSWLLPQLQRFRRLGWWAGTLSAAMLAIELLIIAGTAAAGVTSHFNVSTPFAATLWAIMAFSISALWIATFVASILLFRTQLGDGARSLAIRSGALLALAGMALAFLMTGPQPGQISNFRGVIGAHSVGVADGGPGLPLLGWSTVGGDLRIPHFVGMHALQVIPIALILIELLSRRITVLRDVTVRLRLVLIVATTYAATIALLTWQALRGQSIVHPDAATFSFAVAIAIAAIAAAAVVTRPRRSMTAGPAPA